MRNGFPETKATPRPTPVWTSALANFAFVALLTCAVFILYLQNNDFVLGLHTDEPKKVSFILSGRQDFMHPVLMLQASRIANAFAGLTDTQAVAELGRTISAFFGALFAAATFVLARRSLTFAQSFAAAAVVAALPMTAIHAQALKEDIYVAPFLMLSLAAVLKLMDKATLGNAAWLGLAVAMAASAKYAGLLMLPVAVAAGFIVKPGGRGAYFRAASLSLVVAAAAWALVNAPAFSNPDGFYKGVAHEAFHTASGHLGRYEGPLQTYLAHYLTKELPKGAGWPLVVLGLAGITTALYRLRMATSTIRVMLIFAAIWYLAHELSPMKPNSTRYMIALGPILAIFAIVFLKDAVTRLPSPARQAAFWTAICLTAAWPTALTATQIALAPDTSVTAKQSSSALGDAIFIDDNLWEERRNAEHLAEFAARATMFGEDAAAKLDGEWDYAVTRNMTAEFRIADATDDSAQRRFSRTFHAKPHLLIKHRWRSFDFRNRPIKIVAARGDAGRLEEMARRWRGSPLIVVKYVGAK